MDQNHITVHERILQNDHTLSKLNTGHVLYKFSVQNSATLGPIKGIVIECINKY